MEEPDHVIEAVFGEIDALFRASAASAPPKTHSEKDRQSLEIPFYLKQEGRRGRLHVEPEPRFDGVRVPAHRLPNLNSSIPSAAFPPLDPKSWIENDALSEVVMEEMSTAPLVWSSLPGFTDLRSPAEATSSSSPSPAAATPSSSTSSPAVASSSLGIFHLPDVGTSLSEDRKTPSCRKARIHVPEEAFLVNMCQPSTRICLVRGGDGKVKGYAEQVVDDTMPRVSAKSSREFTRGSVNNKPFRHGGFGDDDTAKTKDESQKSNSSITSSDSLIIDDVIRSIKVGGDEKATLRLGPKGFRGVDFRGDRDTADQEDKGVYKAFVNRTGLIDQGLQMNEEELDRATYFEEMKRRGYFHDDDDSGHNAEEVKLRAQLESQRERAKSLKRELPATKQPVRSRFLSQLTKLRNFGGLRADKKAFEGYGEVTINDILQLSTAGADRTDGDDNGDEKMAARGTGHQKIWARMSEESVANFHEQVPDMAIKYPFELDRFQKQSILHVERSQCVFVAAHTSAGKTVVAEYAVALACRHMTRAVYTSPIKTLSNQKFREFRKTFGESDVGLLTGDVSINPEAACLILTTEILRSMLYRGADLIRDIEWVIFDEVHYINDRDRGVVWEEVIMMLPSHVSIVMLSATVPNTLEFADWVGRTKKKPVYVVTTYKRPVPLQHYLWTHGKMFKILDSSGSFRTEGFRQARIENKRQEKEAAKKRGSGRDGKNRWLQLVQYLLKLQLLPVVIFSFSKRICEELSYALGGLDLNDHKERGLVYGFVDRSVRRLQQVDRKLPQVRRVRELAARGIGVHHAGMLPLLKEVVELLFGRGLIKVLFATETFAMGVNMPTRTVVFNGTRKHDGTKFRDLLPSEYTQMAGRAGRRGLDSFGVVVLFCRNDEIPAETGTKHLLTGKATRLKSRFRLTFNMLLNLLRQEDIQTKDFIKRSFAEASARRAAPQQQAALQIAKEKLNKLPKNGSCDGSMRYLSLREDAEGLYREEVATLMRSHTLGGRYMGTGRILLVFALKIDPRSNDAPLLSTVLTPPQNGNSLTVLVMERDDAKSSAAAVDDSEQKALNTGAEVIVKRGVTQGKERWAIIEIGAENVARLCKQRIRINADDCLSRNERSSQGAIESAISELSKTYQKATKGKRKLGVIGGEGSNSYLSGLGELNPQKDMKIRDMDFLQQYRMRKSVEAELAQSTCALCLCETEKRTNYLSQTRVQRALQKRIGILEAALSDDRIFLLEELRQRLDVLQELDYIGPDRAVLLKGRVACEINTCDSLIVTELIFENVLDDLDCAEAIALLSTLVFQQKSDIEQDISRGLEHALKQLGNIAVAIGNTQLKHGMDIAPQSYARESIKVGLMQATYEWARGTAFHQICELTDVPEGTIVRCILRLHETLKDVRNAARVIGNPQLYQTMERCADMIKRDIVFAASLYVS